MNTQPQEIKDGLCAELESAHRTFHTLFDSLSETDLRTKSHNPGWTNGEILAHMTFGFIILNALFPMARLWGHLPKGASKIFAWILNGFTAPFNSKALTVRTSLAAETLVPPSPRFAACRRTAAAPAT